MRIVVTPVPHPLVKNPEEVFEKVSELLMKEISKGENNIETKGMEVTMNLDQTQEKLFAEQDLRMKIDRTITDNYINILDDVVNRMQ